MMVPFVDYEEARKNRERIEDEHKNGKHIINEQIKHSGRPRGLSLHHKMKPKNNGQSYMHGMGCTDCDNCFVCYKTDCTPAT